MKNWCNHTDRRTPKYSSKNLAQCRFVHHKTRKTCLVIEPGKKKKKKGALTWVLYLMYCGLRLLGLRDWSIIEPKYYFRDHQGDSDEEHRNIIRKQKYDNIFNIQRIWLVTESKIVIRYKIKETENFKVGCSWFFDHKILIFYQMFMTCSLTSNKD
jgi:hypothetical protein